MTKNELYRQVPKVDVLLASDHVRSMIEEYGRDLTVEAIRAELDMLRAAIGKAEDSEAACAEILGQIADVETQVRRRIEEIARLHMCRVINATGTILHTNLGRSQIGAEQMKQIADIATHYSNLEYNLEKQARGTRYAHFEDLLCRITGAEAAMAVNNNAAAVMLILNTMGCGKEMIVSRGELVEIGGKFRVPDVMKQGGVTLVEVGTTNKTHLSDYEEAINENTAALMKVHTSNFSIIGFTENVTAAELTALAADKGIPVIEDLGSGVLIDLAKYGLAHEPMVQESIAAGIDVVCFSGDKLLGGPQAGIIIGKKKYIDMMKKNQLTRALRIDKFTAAALEVVLREYLCEEKAIQNIPTLRMITESAESVAERAAKLAELLAAQAGENAKVKVIDCESQIGGGSLPLVRIPGKGVSVSPAIISVAEAEKRMHHLEIPIIPRVFDNQILLDARTIQTEEAEIIACEMAEVLRG